MRLELRSERGRPFSGKGTAFAMALR